MVFVFCWGGGLKMTAAYQEASCVAFKGVILNLQMYHVCVKYLTSIGTAKCDQSLVCYRSSKDPAHFWALWNSS